MKLLTRGFSATYELESLTRMLFSGAERIPDETPPDTGDWILAEMAPEGEACRLSVTVHLGDETRTAQGTAPMTMTEKERTFPLCRLLYETVCGMTGESLRWGLLTGIRPIKLFHKLAAEGLTERETAQRMQERYLLSDEMTRLALDIRRAEAAINKKSLPNGFSLYISVPFCPQRCSYCSFVSSAVERMRPLIPDYVGRLCREIEETAAIANGLGLRLQTVYIGGGTPTTLDARQLSAVIDTVRRSFDCGGLLEFTVEAGRPDTIDEARLRALHDGGVDRISVNPQTMNDRILRQVGRLHTAEDVERAYTLARKIGFSVINMDLIAGLADETPEEFLSSLSRVMALQPENITVHALTLKRASTLVYEGDAERQYRRRRETARMVDEGRAALTAAGWQPYYLYRQKNTVGALDNTGYAKKGTEGVYNVLIMDETQTILACGAGAVTKLREPGGEEIERIFNYKFPAEYLERFDEMLRRKGRVKQFYEDCLSKP